MIAALAFEPAPAAPQGQRVRRPRFVPRSTLPLAAMCLVANGVREHLGSLLARELEVDLTEASVPDAAARGVIFRETHVVRVRGRVADAFVAVRARDARRLVALAFGEGERDERDPLSEIETRTFERLLAAVVQQSAPLCGTIGGSAPERAERAAEETVSYFEVRTSGTHRCAIGFGLTADPPEEVSVRIALEDLLDVSLDVRVDCPVGVRTIGELAKLDAGSTLAVDGGFDRSALLRTGSLTLAAGSCGASAGRSALRVERLGAVS